MVVKKSLLNEFAWNGGKRKNCHYGFITWNTLQYLGKPIKQVRKRKHETMKKRTKKRKKKKKKEKKIKS